METDFAKMLEKTPARVHLWISYGLQDGKSAARAWKKFHSIRQYDNITEGFAKIYFDAFVDGMLQEFGLKI
jgi:hypothetical protein